MVRILYNRFLTKYHIVRDIFMTQVACFVILMFSVKDNPVAIGKFTMKIEIMVH